MLYNSITGAVMNKSEIDIRKKILEIQSNIRRKAAALKLSRSETDESLKKLYKPLIEPIQEITSHIKNHGKRVKTEETAFQYIKQHAGKIEQPTIETVTKPHTEFTYLPVDYENEDDNVFIDEKSTSHNQHILNEFLEQYEDIPRRYVHDMITVGLKNLAKAGYDTSLYGLKYDDQTEKWTIGDSECKIVNNTLVIKDKIYPGTVGLYELLLKANPLGYDSRDEQNYLDILNSTNTLRRNFDSNEPIRGGRSRKYAETIKPLIDRKPISSGTRKQSTSSKDLKNRLGYGIKTVSNYTNFYDSSMLVDDRRPKYVYWDDVNEMVDRLALLWASKQASDGACTHDNEIMSIVEELREAGYIY